jgi:FkbM family methyltransferase
MPIHFLRKHIRKIGIDFHKFRHENDTFFQFKSLNIHTVIDIGANIGQFAHEIRSTLPTAQIISFEPIKECYDQLVESFSKDQYFTAHHVALGDQSSTLNMNKSAYTPSSSLLPMAEKHKKLFPHTKEQTAEAVEVKRLDDVLSGQTLHSGILIKIDVQGFEDKVIDGGPETFKKASAAIIETSFSAFYEGQPLFDDIYKKMTALGFSYRSSLHQKKDKKTGEILFEDSIFVREK